MVSQCELFENDPFHFFQERFLSPEALQLRAKEKGYPFQHAWLARFFETGLWQPQRRKVLVKIIT